MHGYFLKQVEAVSEEYVNLLMKMSVVFKGKNKFAQVLNSSTTLFVLNV